jgi:hypothetical protein
LVPLEPRYCAVYVYVLLSQTPLINDFRVAYTVSPFTGRPVTATEVVVIAGET